MIDKSRLYLITEVEKLRDQLNEAEYPEVYGFIDHLWTGGELENISPYDIAGKLMALDSPKAFPRYIISFIEQLYMIEIKAGNADAMNDLGAHYYEANRGFAQDFEKAVNYYTMAAEHGSRVAQENLGFCYYYGRNMQPDYEKAFHCFALGAFDGHLISLYKIGDMYLNGYYVNRNPEEAFHIYMHCLQTMAEEAEQYVAGPVYLRLGKMFLNGTGTEVNVKNALVCLQKAESFLFDMVLAGDVKYRKSLEAAVRYQAEARKKLSEMLPDREWIDE